MRYNVEGNYSNSKNGVFEKEIFAGLDEKENILHGDINRYNPHYNPSHETGESFGIVYPGKRKEKILILNYNSGEFHILDKKDFFRKKRTEGDYKGVLYSVNGEDIDYNELKSNTKPVLENLKEKVLSNGNKKGGIELKIERENGRIF